MKIVLAGHAANRYILVCGTTVPKKQIGENDMTAIYTSTHQGQTARRKSAGHIKQQYFFAIWVLSRPYWQPEAEYTWSCEAYASRINLAQATARSWEKSQATKEVAIVPVACTVKLTKRQQEWADALPKDLLAGIQSI
jgi:hypothetical protein